MPSSNPPPYVTGAINILDTAPVEDNVSDGVVENRDSDKEFESFESVNGEEIEEVRSCHGGKQ